MNEFIEKPTGICIHHSKTKDTETVSTTAIRRVQMAEMGFDEIAYTMIIEDVAGEMRIYTGRPSFLQGAHEKTLNRSHLSICLIGDYDKKVPEDRKIEAVIRGCLSLMLMNPQIRPENVTFHNEHNPKSCPGKLFPREGFLLGLHDRYAEMLEGKL